VFKEQSLDEMPFVSAFLVITLAVSMNTEFLTSSFDFELVTSAPSDQSSFLRATSPPDYYISFTDFQETKREAPQLAPTLDPASLAPSVSLYPPTKSDHLILSASFY
jgi:hypothetical protein